MPELEQNFSEVVKDHTAGDPQQPGVVWTYLTPREIAEGLTKLGTPVCTDTARKLFTEFGFARRQVQKKRAMGTSPHRDAQFGQQKGTFYFIKSRGLLKGELYQSSYKVECPLLLDENWRETAMCSILLDFRSSILGITVLLVGVFLTFAAPQDEGHHLVPKQANSLGFFTV